MNIWKARRSDLQEPVKRFLSRLTPSMLTRDIKIKELVFEIDKLQKYLAEHSIYLVVIESEDE